jgi:hypothetical protein
MIGLCAPVLPDCQGVLACRRQQHDMGNKKGLHQKGSPIFNFKINRLFVYRLFSLWLTFCSG